MRLRRRRERDRERQASETVWDSPEEREVRLRRYKEILRAKQASETVEKKQVRLEHTASYGHTHLQQLATNWQQRLASETTDERESRLQQNR